MAQNGKSLVKLRGKIYYENFTVNGQRFRRSIDTGDKDTAELIAAKTRLDALLGNLTGKKPEITLDAALGRYWLEQAHDLPSADSIKYRGLVLRAGLGKQTLLSRITPASLTTYASRRRVGEITHVPESPRRWVRIANGTVNLELRLLRTVIIRARDVWGFETPSIRWRDILLEEADERQHILSREEQKRLLRELRPDYHAIVRFLLITGARIGNVIGLTWRQVHWDEGRIEFRLKSEKPGGELHYVPLTKELRAILSVERGKHPRYVFTFVCRQNYYDRRTKTQRVKGARYPFTKPGFNYEWYRATTEAELWYGKKSRDNLRPHDLRHTAATRTLAGCGNLKTVKKMLGHRNISTTERYARTDVEDVRQAMEGTAKAQSRHR